VIGIKSYFMSIIAAAIVCYIATGLTNNKGVASTIVKMICGLYMIATVLRPLPNIRFDNLSGVFDDLTHQSNIIVAEGEIAAQTEMSAIIKEQVEAYILDKATALDLNVSVEVGMSESEPQIPESVILKGSVSPFKKQRMEQILSQELGIAKENQLWE
jgi:hypothetical protein